MLDVSPLGLDQLSFFVSSLCVLPLMCAVASPCIRPFMASLKWRQRLSKTWIVLWSSGPLGLPR